MPNREFEVARGAHLNASPLGSREPPIPSAR